MDNHPHLINLYQLYQREQQPFRKVHRMVDLFESLIKFHTVVIMAEYFARNAISDSAKGMLSYGLQTPSLGTWQFFSRQLYKELQTMGHQFMLNSFPDEFRILEKIINKERTNIIALRNHYAHGATPSDEECLRDIFQFENFLELLLGFKWLAQSSLHEEYGIVSLKVLDTGKQISLHPLMVCRPEGDAQPFAFFNDLKNRGVGLLNYPISKYYRDKEFFSEFHDYLPLNEWKQTSQNEFAQRIEELSETFKGRLEEIKRIKAFINSNKKGYFSILGNPGIGKSALITQVFKEMKNHRDRPPIHLTVYFIRRGTLHAQPHYLLEYLIRKTDSFFKEGQNIRPEARNNWELQQILFDKWRAYGQGEEKPALVFFIDGLDEGVESGLLSFLPREVFQNILIIYASRPGGHRDLQRFWNELPTVHHEILKLGGLKRQDIRALLYEVANKYKLDDSWVNELERRSQGNPLYLKLLCDALEVKTIQINDANALPEKIEGYYKAVLDRYARLPDGDNLLNSLFTFAAAKDYLTSFHIGQINSLGAASQQRVMGTLSEVLNEYPISENMQGYQLFHETFREYLKKVHASEVRQAEKRIVTYCNKWAEYSNWEQHYALLHFAVHLSHLSGNNHMKRLLKLAEDQSYQTTQKRMLRSFKSTRTLQRLAMDAGYKLNDKKAIFNSAIALIELRRDEMNDIRAIVEMVQKFDIDQALHRIGHLSDNSKESYERLFKVYAICLIDLTICQIGDDEERKQAVCRLLEHMSEYTPGQDFNQLNWNYLVPCNLMFSIMTKIAQWRLDVKVILDRTSNALDEHVFLMGPFDHFQFELLNQAISSMRDDTKYFWGKAQALTAVSVAKARQGYFEQALETANEIELSCEKAQALTAISTAMARQGDQKQARGALLVAQKVIFEIAEEREKAEALTTISSAMFWLGLIEQSRDTLQDAMEMANEIELSWEKARALLAVSSAMAEQGRLEQALQIANKIECSWRKAQALMVISSAMFGQGFQEQAMGTLFVTHETIYEITNELEKVEALTDLSSAMYEKGLQEQARVILQEALEMANVVKLSWEKARGLTAISTSMAEQGYFEQALETAKEIADESSKAHALTAISTVMTGQGLHEQAKDTLLVALETVNDIELSWEKALAPTVKSTFMASQGYFEQALEMAKEIADEQEKVEALTAILTAMASQGYLEQALETANEITNETGVIWGKAYAIAAISTAVAKQGHFEQALETVKEIADVRIKTGTLMAISTVMSEHGLKEQAMDSLLVAHETVYEIEDELDIAGALTDLSSAMFKQGFQEQARDTLLEALQTANSIVSIWGKGQALLDVSSGMAEQGCFEQALQTANEIVSSLNKKFALRAISTAMAVQGHFKQALETVNVLADDSDRFLAWEEIGSRQYKEKGLSYIKSELPKLPDETARLFYLKGVAAEIKPTLATEDEVLGILKLIKEDVESIEHVLHMHVLHCLFFGILPNDKHAAFRRVFDTQRAMEIANKLSNHYARTRGSVSVKEWIHEIPEADDREDVLGWAEKVQQGNLTEDQFIKRVKRIDKQKSDEP